MNVHRALFNEDVIPPHVVEQLRARINALGMRHQKMQEAKLRRAQLERPAVADHSVPGRIEPETGNLDNIVGRVGRHLEASIVHDWLYVAWQVTGVMPQRHMWRFANDVMYSAMRKAGVSKPQIGVVKLGLECPPFSWRVFKTPEIGSPLADMSQQ